MTTRTDACATCEHNWHGLPCRGNTHITNWPNLTCPCPGPYAQPATDNELEEQP